MTLVHMNTNGWNTYCNILKTLREECASRQIDTTGLSAVIGGTSDYCNGLLELSSKDADGTTIERFERARMGQRGQTGPTTCTSSTTEA